MRELMIQNGSKAYQPVLMDSVEWTTERKDSPGKLTFKVMKDEKLNITEGNPVSFKVDDKNIFYGFIFSQKRDKDQQIQITAYDQIRYLKNKDTYVYSDKRADQVVKMIASDFGLRTGTLENTGYVIPSRVEENTALIDMIMNALDQTLLNKSEMYVLYDDYGKLNLKNLERMKLGVVIDEETGVNFDYSSSIDEDTYNKVKLTFDNDETGSREIYIAQSGANINNWGTLQYFDTLKEGENGKAKADALLDLYNTKTRKLKISDAIGHVDVRGGSMVIVNLNLGDKSLKNFMLVEQCTHTFKESEHFMNLTLRGGEFIA